MPYSIKLLQDKKFVYFITGVFFPILFTGVLRFYQRFSTVKVLCNGPLVFVKDIKNDRYGLIIHDTLGNTYIITQHLASRDSNL